MRHLSPLSWAPPPWAARPALMPPGAKTASNTANSTISIAKFLIEFRAWLRRMSASCAVCAGHPLACAEGKRKRGCRMAELICRSMYYSLWQSLLRWKARKNGLGTCKGSLSAGISTVSAQDCAPSCGLSVVAEGSALRSPFRQLCRASVRATLVPGRGCRCRYCRTD